MRSIRFCFLVRRSPRPQSHIHTTTTSHAHHNPAGPFPQPPHPPNPHNHAQPNPTDYLASLDPHLADPLPRTLLILSFTLTLSYLAWRGLDVAGKLAIAICIGCLLPFVALCVAGAFHLDMGRARTWRDDVDGVRVVWRCGSWVRGLQGGDWRSRR